MPNVRCNAVAQSSRGRFGFAAGAGLGGGGDGSITSARRLALGGASNLDTHRREAPSQSSPATLKIQGKVTFTFPPPIGGGNVMWSTTARTQARTLSPTSFSEVVL